MSFGDLGDDRMDRLAALESFGSLGGGRRQAQYPALPPEEAESALKRLRNTGLSSLGYVGSVLDKFGGRAVRGSLDALMGHGGSREILSLIPFSDTLGITDPAAIETHRGAQLLKHGLGYDPEQAHGHWGAWAERNLLGPAVEIGLDPATWAGGVGALTKAGRAAAKLGKVPGIFRPGYLGALRARRAHARPWDQGEACGRDRAGGHAGDGGGDRGGEPALATFAQDLPGDGRRR